ncbi:dihydrofolate reductase family protein [Novosphingobium sp. MW5]|nr:dihydrofolate reductase family protein [Novosphingobium sp. MW5]
MNDEEVFETVGSWFAGSYDLLLGRRTYDIFAAYWPFVEGEEKPMGEAFDAAGKHVLMRSSQPLDWANSHRLSGVEDVAKLKASEGPDLVIQGSSTIYPALLAAGLIDRLSLIIYPIVLGKGKRLFGEGTAPGLLKLVDSRVTSKGTIIATYEPGGTIPATGDFPQPSTSAAEAERQRRMAEGTW